MADTVEDIFNDMVDEKQMLPSLQGLMPQYDLAPPTPDNPFIKLLNGIANASQMAIWELSIYIVAEAINKFEQMLDQWKAEAQQIANAAPPTTIKWWLAQVPMWQYGYALIWNGINRTWYYSDTTSSAAIAARLVVACAVQEVFTQEFSGVVFKVAKSNGTGGLMPLDTTPGTEFDSLNTYIKQLKPAGRNTSLITINSDWLALNVDVYYDGTLEWATVQAALIASINTFLQTIQLNDQGGTLNLIDLVNAMEVTSGLVDPFVNIEEAQCRPDAGSYQVVNQSYEPASGYFQLDVANSIFNPIPSTIN